MSKCLSDNFTRVHVEETIMTIRNKRNVVGYVPLKAGRCLEIEPVLGLHSKVLQTILVKMQKQRTYDANKISAALKEIRLTKEAVARIPKPKDIISNSPDILAKN